MRKIDWLKYEIKLFCPTKFYLLRGGTQLGRPGAGAAKRGGGDAQLGRPGAAKKGAAPQHCLSAASRLIFSFVACVQEVYNKTKNQRRQKNQASSPQIGTEAGLTGQQGLRGHLGPAKGGHPGLPLQMPFQPAIRKSFLRYEDPFMI